MLDYTIVSIKKTRAEQMKNKLLNCAIKPTIAEDGIHRPLVAARGIRKYCTTYLKRPIKNIQKKDLNDK